MNIGFICIFITLLLHFHRDDWNRKLDEIFKQYHLGDGKYQKNYENIYDIVNCYDGVNTAIKNAKRRMAEFHKGGCRPSEYDPGTTVYQLLKRYLDK